MRKNTNMSTALVTEGIELFADIDDALAEILVKAQRIVEIYELGIAEGMVHGLAAKELIWDVRRVPGDVAGLAERFAHLHVIGQKIAAKNGQDTGELERVGGIVVPFSGGR